MMTFRMCHVIFRIYYVIYLGCGHNKCLRSSYLRAMICVRVCVLFTVSGCKNANDEGNGCGEEQTAGEVC